MGINALLGTTKSQLIIQFVIQSILQYNIQVFHSLTDNGADSPLNDGSWMAVHNHVTYYGVFDVLEYLIDNRYLEKGISD